LGYSIINLARCRRCFRRLPIQMLKNGLCAHCREEVLRGRLLEGIKMCVTCRNEEGRPEVLFIGYWEGQKFHVCIKCLARAMNWKTLPRNQAGTPTLRWGWERKSK
jgi:hypothetical protein